MPELPDGTRRLLANIERFQTRCHVLREPSVEVVGFKGGFRLEGFRRGCRVYHQGFSRELLDSYYDISVEEAHENFQAVYGRTAEDRKKLQESMNKNVRLRNDMLWSKHRNGSTPSLKPTREVLEVHQKDGFCVLNVHGPFSLVFCDIGAPEVGDRVEFSWKGGVESYALDFWKPKGFWDFIEEED